MPEQYANLLDEFIKRRLQRPVSQIPVAEGGGYIPPKVPTAGGGPLEHPAQRVKYVPPPESVKALRSLHTDNPDMDSAKSFSKAADVIARIYNQHSPDRVLAPDVHLALLLSGLGPRSLDELLKSNPSALGFSPMAKETLERVTGKKLEEPKIPQVGAQPPPPSPAGILKDAAGQLGRIAGKEPAKTLVEPEPKPPEPGLLQPPPLDSSAPAAFARQTTEVNVARKAEEKFQKQAEGMVKITELEGLRDYVEEAENLSRDPNPLPREDTVEHAERQRRIKQLDEFRRHEAAGDVEATTPGPRPEETLEQYIERRTLMQQNPAWVAPPIDWNAVRADAQEKFKTEMPAAVGYPVQEQLGKWKEDKDLYAKVETEKQSLYGIREKVKTIDPAVLPPDFSMAELDKAIFEYEFMQEQFLRGFMQAQFLRGVQGPLGEELDSELDPEKVFGKAFVKIIMRPPFQTLAAEQRDERVAALRRWTELAKKGEGGTLHGLTPVPGVRVNLKDEDLNADSARGLDPDTPVYVGGLEAGFRRVPLSDVIFSDTVGPGAFIYPKEQRDYERAAEFWKDKSPIPANVDEVRKNLETLPAWDVGALQRFLGERDYPVVITEKVDDQTVLALSAHYLNYAVLDLDNENESRRKRAEEYLTSWGQMLSGVRDEYGIQVKPGLYETVPGLFNLERRTGEPSLPENQPGIPKSEQERRYWVRRNLLEHFSTGLPADMAAEQVPPIVSLARTLADKSNPDRFKEAFPITTSLIYDTGIGKQTRYDLYRRTAPAGYAEEQMIRDYRISYGGDAVPESIKNKYLTGWEHTLKNDFSQALAGIGENLGDFGEEVVRLKGWLDGKAEADPEGNFAGNWEALKMTADGFADMTKTAGGAVGDVAGPVGETALNAIDAGGRNLMFWTLVAKTGISGLVNGEMSNLYDNFWRWRDVSQNTGGENLLMKDLGVDPERHPLAAFALELGMESAALMGVGSLAKIGAKAAGLDRAFTKSLVSTGLADDTFKLISETEDIPTIVRLTGKAPGVEGQFLNELKLSKTPAQARGAYDNWVGELGVNPEAWLVKNPFELTPGNALRQAVTRIAEAGRMDFVPRWFRPWLTASEETVNGLDRSLHSIYETIEHEGQQVGMKKLEIDDWMNTAFTNQMESAVASTAGGPVARASGITHENRFLDEWRDEAFRRVVDEISPGTSPDEFLKAFPVSMHDEIARGNRSLVERAVTDAAEKGNSAALAIAGKMGWKDVKQSDYGEKVLTIMRGKGKASAAAVDEAAIAAEAKMAEVPDMFETLYRYAEGEGLFKPPALNPQNADDYIKNIRATAQLDDLTSEYKSLMVDDIMEGGAQKADDIEKELARRLKGDENFKKIEETYNRHVSDLMAQPAYSGAKDVRELFKDVLPDDGLDYLVNLVGKMRRAGTYIEDTRPRPVTPSALSYNYRGKIPFTYIASLKQLQHALPGGVTREELQNFFHLDSLHKLWKSSILFGWGTQAKIAFDDISRLLLMGINPLWGRQGKGRYKWFNIPDDVAEGDLRRITAGAAAPQDYRTFGPGHEPLTRKAYEHWAGMQAHDPFARAWIKADDAALSKGLAGAEREKYVRDAFTAYARKNFKNVEAEGYRALPYADDPKTVTSLYRNVPKTEKQAAAEIAMLDDFYRTEVRFGDENVKKMMLRASEKSSEKKPFKMRDEEWNLVEGMRPTVWAAEDAAERFYRQGLLGALARGTRRTVNAVYTPLSTASSWSRGAVYSRYFDEAFDDLVNVANPTAQTYKNASYLADRHARKMVDSITYNLARTPLEHALRNIVPFGPAYRDFYVFWTKHLARHPMQAAAITRAQDMPADAQTQLGRGVAGWVPYIGDKLASLANMFMGVGAAGPLTVFRYNPKSAFFLTGGLSNFLPSAGPLLTIPLSKLIESDPEGYAWIQSIPGFAFANPDSAMFSKLDKLLYATTGAMSLVPGLNKVVDKPYSMGRPLGIPLGFSDSYIEKREEAEFAWLFSEWVKDTGLTYSWMSRAGQFSIPLPDSATRDELRKQAHENVIRQQGLLFAGQFLSPAGLYMETPAYQLDRARSLVLRAETPADRAAVVSLLSGKGGPLPQYLVGKGAGPLPLAPELRHYPEKIAEYYGRSPTGRKQFLFENPTLLALVAPRTIQGSSLVPVQDLDSGGEEKPGRERASLDEFVEKIISPMVDAQTLFTQGFLKGVAGEARKKVWSDIEAAQGKELSQQQGSGRGWEILGVPDRPKEYSDTEKRAYAEYLLTSVQGPYSTRYAEVFPLVAKKEEEKRIAEWTKLEGREDLTNISAEQAASLGLPHDAPTMAVLQEYYLTEDNIKKRMEEQGVSGFTSKDGRVFAAELDARIAAFSEKSPSFAEIYRMSKLPEWARLRDLRLVAPNPATQDEWAQTFGILDNMTKKMAELKSTKDKDAVHKAAMAELETLKKNEAFTKELNSFLGDKSDLKPTAAQLRAYKGDYATATPSTGGGGRRGRGGRRGGRRGGTRRGKRGRSSVGATGIRKGKKRRSVRVSI